MTVEIRHLRAMIALSDAESFTVAAAVLGTTQPTLSRTISQLEASLGTRLVDRTTRGLTLTVEGARLVEETRPLLDRLERVLESVASEVIPPLRLGWAWAGLGRHMVPLLRQWNASSPVTVRLSRADDPLCAVKSGEIDAAIVRHTAVEPWDATGLGVASLLAESLVAAVPADSPLAEQDEVSLDDLGAHTMALCAVSPTATLKLWQGKSEIPRRVLVENTEEWLTQIALGDAVGLTSAATSFEHVFPDVEYRPLSDSPEVKVDLVWNLRGAHSAVEPFSKLARRYFESLVSGGAPPQVIAVE